METPETTEITFLNVVHGVTSKADALIERYIETAATIAALPPEFEFPNQEEAVEFATTTAMTLGELRTLVVLFAEHTAKFNDKVEEALTKMETLKKE